MSIPCPSAGHPLPQAVVDRQRLPDHAGQDLGVEAEVAVDLHQQPLGVDRHEHPRRGGEPVQVADRPAHRGGQELAGHVGVVGLDDVAAVELRIADPDQPRPLRRLRRRRPRGGGQFHPEGEPAAEPGHDPGPRGLRLARDLGRQAHPDRRAVVREADRRRVGQPPALIFPPEECRQLPVGLVTPAREPRAARRDQADEQVEDQDDQPEDHQVHRSCPRPFPPRPPRTLAAQSSLRMSDREKQSRGPLFARAGRAPTG